MDETPRPSAPITARDLFRVARRRLPLFLFTFAVVVGLTFYLTSLMRPVYEGKARIQIDTPMETAMPSNLFDLINGRSSGGSLDTEIEKVRARPFLEKIIRQAKLKNINAEVLKSRLSLGPGPGGKILDIAVRADSAAEAKRLANIIAADYISLAQTEYERKTELSQKRLKAAQANSSQAKKEADAEIARFKNRAGISEPGLLYSKSATTTADVRNALDSSLRNLPLQIINLQTKQARLAKIPAEVIVGYSLNKNPTIDGYRALLADLETKKKGLQFDYGDDSDEIAAINAEIKARKEAIADAEKDMFSPGSRGVSRNGDYSVLQSDIQKSVLEILETRNAIASYRTQLVTLAAEQKRNIADQTTYEGLLRKRQSATDTYEQARQGLQKLETSRILSAPNIEVMESAILPDYPISPKPWLNALMAVTLGLFLGLGMALLAEYMASGNVIEEELPELPRLGGVPLLGVLPIALPAPSRSSGVGLPALLSQTNAAGTLDALREIGFTLAHRHRKEQVPVILLAGARTDDASAGFAAQLAGTLARDGVRVTLIDADRGQPRLSDVFGVPDAPGLADAIAGRRKAKEILHSAADGALRFLAAGSPDDNAGMSEEKLRGVFKELSEPQETDIVLVSGPSVWQVGLIGPLERAAKGMVLVAPEEARGLSPAESVARARRLLSNGYRPRILGVVIDVAEELIAPHGEPVALTDKQEEE